MSTILNWIMIRKWFAATIAVLVVIIIGLLFKNGNSNQGIYVVTAKSLSSDVVTVSGKVVPVDDADLSFEISGKVESVNVREGDKVSVGSVLASLEASDVRADLLKAEADLIAEKAKLDELKSTETLNVSEVGSAEQGLIREMKNAFTISDDAIRNKTDQFFSDTNTGRPQILFYFGDYYLKEEINKERKEIELLLREWSDSSQELDVDNYDVEDISLTKSNLEAVRNFLELVSSAVNKFEPVGSVTSSDISGYKSDTASARTNVNNALSSLIDAEENLRSTVSKIPYQEALVKSAEATVASKKASLIKMSIRAPFSGTVSVREIDPGEIVSVNQKAFTLISSGNVEVETYMPEIYISGIKVGNTAKITLDAYGEDVSFDGLVSYIDPAATEKDGVTSYKLKIQFNSTDERIRSGMTARADISAEVQKQSLIIPKKAVYSRNGEKFIIIKQSDNSEKERLVSVGEEQDEFIEITSGISVGEIVVVPK